MRILYMPIFEGGSVHDTQFAQKRGLYTALAKAGHSVVELDYLDFFETQDNPSEEVLDFMGDIDAAFDFDLILSQFHGANILTPEQIRNFRSIRPYLKWLNWSGDSWAHSLTAQPILDMAREFDLQLVAAPDALPVYEANGINAAYWNIALEQPTFMPVPDMPTHDVVFLANVINDKRRALMEFLKSLEGVNVGIYGDWDRADGRNVYDFTAGEGLYQKAAIAIADNVYQDQQNYVSNRPMQAMGAGCFVLHQHVPKMLELTGWVAGKHYEEWYNFEDLEQKIRYWLQPKQQRERLAIAIQGSLYTQDYHTWDARVRTLFNELLPKVRERT